jgi:TorA maturation chaperone TorD
MAKSIASAFAEEDRWRASYYALISRALANPPTPEFLSELRALAGDDSPLGVALDGLAAAAAEADPASLEDEYSKLFYGMGQGGEILPYASYYITGHLNDRPLARLRGDMERLGIAHGGRNSEPEDHFAFLCEMMHGLILGNFGLGPADLAEQQRFFDQHIAPWAKDFLEDLEAAESAVFYAAVARLGGVFLAIEEDAFKLAA